MANVSNNSLTYLR